MKFQEATSENVAYSTAGHASIAPVAAEPIGAEHTSIPMTPLTIPRRTAISTARIPYAPWHHCRRTFRSQTPRSGTTSGDAIAGHVPTCIQPGRSGGGDPVTGFDPAELVHVASAAPTTLLPVPSSSTMSYTAMLVLMGEYSSVLSVATAIASKADDRPARGAMTV